MPDSFAAHPSDVGARKFPALLMGKKASSQQSNLLRWRMPTVARSWICYFDKRPAGTLTGELETLILPIQSITIACKI
jgi:hypothetical protein